MNRGGSENRQGSEIWDCSPALAAVPHQPFGCMAPQCTAVIPAQVLVHKLLWIYSGQLPSAAELWGCGAAAAGFAAQGWPVPRCGLCPRFHGSASSGHRAKSLPRVILLNWVGPLPPGQSSRSRLGSRTTWKGLGRKVQLYLQQEKWITSPRWHRAPFTEGQTAFGAWPLQLGPVSVWDEIYLTLTIKKMGVAWAWAVYFAQWRRVGLLHPRSFILVLRCDNLPSTLDHLHPDNVIPPCLDQVTQFWKSSSWGWKKPSEETPGFLAAANPHAQESLPSWLGLSCDGLPLSVWQHRQRGLETADTKQNIALKITWYPWIFI